jgi:toxin ParE1/3/4
MNALQLVLASDAIKDIDQAVRYYNSVSEGLGGEFVDTIDRYFQQILQVPKASAIRYDQVRVKPVNTFPFAIHYTITVSEIIILRVFNTHQRPIITR